MPVLLVCTIICFLSIRSFESYVFKNSEQKVSTIKDDIDERIYEFIRFSRSIELSGENYTIKSMNQNDGNVETMYKLSNSLRKYLNVNDFSDSMYIYYPVIDRVISDRGCFNTKAFYRLREMSSLDNFDEWKAILLSDEKRGIIQIPHHGEQKLAYVNRLYNNDGICMVLVIEISNKSLKNILESYTTDEDTASGLLLNNQLIADAGEEYLIAEYGDMTTPNLYKADESITRRHNIYSLQSDSSFSGLKYMMIGTTEDLFKPINVVLWCCIAGVGMIFLMLLFISLKISRKDSRFMQKIIDKIGNTDLYQDENDAGAYIEKRIDALIMDYYKNEHQMLERQTRLSNLFVSKIIGKTYANESEIFQIATQHGITFDYLLYRVVVVHIKINPNDVNDVLSRLSEAASQSEANTYSTYSNDQCIILLNCDFADDNDAVKRFVNNVLIKVFADCSAIATVGTSCDTTLGINDSYMQAMTVLKKGGSESDADYTVRLYDNSKHSTPSDNSKEKEGLAVSRQEVKIAEKIKQRIDADYCNPDMGLYLIAEELKFSNSYLSMTFKKIYGLGVIQYINGKRVEEAKRLLIETDKNVKEIAGEVGFSSDISFIRVFKKYENTTPAALRNLLNS